MLSLSPTLGFTTSGTSTRRLCYWRASPSTWRPRGSGHADPAITLRVYAHVNEQLAEAATNFADRVDGAG